MTAIMLALVGLQVLTLSAGQVLWKMGIDAAGGFLPPDRTLVDSVIALLMQPAFLVGSLLYVLATGVWFYLLARHDLGLVYPMLSLTYVVTFIGGWLILGEPVSVQRLLAIGVITAGVILLTQT